MADYEPKYRYAEEATSTASATVTGEQTLVVSGSGTLAPAGADAANCVGVAAQDAAANARFSYFPRGKIHITTTAGAVTAGNNTFTAANGTVDDTGTAANKVGVFLTSAGSGEKAEWMEM